MDTITTHVDDAKARLRSQYKDDEVVVKIIEVLAGRTQVLENALDTFKGRISFEFGEGVQLDNLGKVLGQPRRHGQDDATYLQWLQFRVKELLSEGTIEDLIFVCKFVMGATSVVYQAMFPAHFLLNAQDPDPAVSFSEVRQAIGGAKAAGVGYDVLIYPDVPFTFFNDPEGEGFSGIEVDDGGYLAGIF